MSHNERQIAIMLFVAFISGFFGVQAFVKAYLSHKIGSVKTESDAKGADSASVVTDGVYDYTPHELTDKIFTGCLLVAMALFLAVWAFRRLGIV